MTIDTENLNTIVVNQPVAVAAATGDAELSATDRLRTANTALRFYGNNTKVKLFFLRNRVAHLVRESRAFSPCFIFARDLDISFSFVKSFLSHDVVKKVGIRVFAPSTAKDFVKGLEYFLMTGGGDATRGQDGSLSPLFIDATCLFAVNEISSLEFMFGKIGRRVRAIEESCQRCVVFMLPNAFVETFPQIAPMFWKRKKLFSLI